MKNVYEISKKAARDCGGVQKAIDAGYFTVWNDERIKRAFNFGNGTIDDFKRYAISNMTYCYFLPEGWNG